MYNRKYLSQIFTLLGSIYLINLVMGCSSTTVKTTEIVPVIQETQEIDEALILDVGISLFDPGYQEQLATDDEDPLVFDQVRHAEARYFPHLLAETLQSSGAWGAVRVIPNAKTIVDVLLEGKILHSDGESMQIAMKVSDASGQIWFEKEYTAVASRYSYDDKRQTEADAFQNIYNQVANDLLIYKNALAAQTILNIRTIAELKFAQEFAPVAYQDHLSTNKQGQLSIAQLPAPNDPMLARIRQIRERDHLFIDTLQEYYITFARAMKLPYWRWRKASYDEVMALRSLENSSDGRLAAGAAALVAGILAAGNSGNNVVRASGTATMAAGGYLIKSGIDQSSQSKIHVDALQELGDSLEADINSQIIELDDRSITLSGTVDNQYQQWKAILLQIYQLDTGLETETAIQTNDTPDQP